MKYFSNPLNAFFLKVISFSLKNKNSKVRLISVKKIKRVYELQIYVNGRKYYFYSNNKNENNLYNILATLASLNFFIDIKRIKKNTFLKFKIPEGRGDISRVKFKNKNIVIVDESYNSNPLSLKVAIENFDNIKLKKSKKYLILGDMLELGKHSIIQHRLISKIINKTKINKVYVYGKYIKETFKGLNTNKKAKILDDKSKILELVNKVFRNNDHIMIKGSNSTGLNEITNKLKERNLNAL